MKKTLIVLLILMNLTSIQAEKNTPTYKIIANSNNKKDIEQIYEIKTNLIKDYLEWSKGVDDKYQVLADHTDKYNAEFYNGEYVIKVGNAKGKEITGKLQASYCNSTKEIKKKSIIEELFS